MKDFISLRVLDRLRSGLEVMGLDYPTLRKILQVKLTMDSRRTPTVFNRNTRQSGDKNGFIRSLWLYVLMGLILIPLVVAGDNYLFQMSLTFAMLMFFVMTSMISDFSTVLLDIRDRVILLTKPIDRRTVGFARAIHITMYLILLTMSLAGPSLVASFVVRGLWFGMAFLLGLGLMDLLIIALTALLYLLFLNFFDGERLKDLINYVQIGLSIAILLAYQLMGRIFEVLKLQVVFHAAWWQAVLPPVWFGSVFAWGFGPNPQGPIAGLALMAVVIPMILFVGYVWTMPLFESRLQRLAMGKAASKPRNRGGRRLAWMFCRNPEERSFFEFAGLMMARERDFKLKVYPSLGFAIALPLLVMFNPAWSHQSHQLNSGHWYLAIYMMGFMIPTVIMMLRYSSQFKAAWIYQAAPIQHRENIYRGSVKAVLIRLFLPIFAIESVIFVLLFGTGVILDLLAALLAMLIYAVLSFRWLGLGLPFSEPFQMAQQRKRWVIWLLLLMLGVLAGLHFMFTLLPMGLYLYLAILLLVNGMAWTWGFRQKKQVSGG